MRVKLIWALMLVGGIIGIAGCSNQPTVYLYGKYLSDNQKEQLQRKLLENAYQVEVNDLDFPTSITRNTILYSLFLEDPQLITKAETVADSVGLPIDRTQSLTEGNHWYTKNSLAMFLLPEATVGTTPIFQQDLAHTYFSENCSAELSLTLYKNGQYQLKADAQAKLEAALLEGTWEYRQFPYLELKRQGAQFSDFYFEISRYLGADKVSEIEYIKLSVLSLQHFPQECVFLYGQRV